MSSSMEAMEEDGGMGMETTVVESVEVGVVENGEGRVDRGEEEEEEEEEDADDGGREERRTVDKVVVEKALSMLKKYADRRRRSGSGKNGGGGRSILGGLKEGETPSFVKEELVMRANRKRRRNGVEVDLDAVEQGVDMLSRESETYKRLVSLEKQLDLSIMRKHVELKDSLGRHLSIVPRVFRLYVSSSSSLLPRPRWSLRVWGKLLPDENYHVAPLKAKFGSLIRRVDVEMDHRQGNRQQSQLLRWCRAANEPLTDGFNILRNNATDMDDFSVKLSFFFSPTPELFRVNEPLASLIGTRCDTKSGVLLGAWHYVRRHGLQCYEDKSKIRLDEGLQKLLNMQFDKNKVFVTKLCSLFDMVKGFLEPLDPFTVVHRIPVPKGDGDQWENHECFDIRVDIPDETHVTKVEESGVLSAVWPTANEQAVSLPIDEYNDVKHVHFDAVERLGRHKRRRDLLTRLYRDPVDFVNLLSTSQARDLRVVRGATGRNPEEERRSQYYYQQWVHDVIPRYLLRKSILDTESRALNAFANLGNKQLFQP